MIYYRLKCIGNVPDIVGNVLPVAAGSRANRPYISHMTMNREQEHAETLFKPTGMKSRQVKLNANVKKQGYYQRNVVVYGY